MITEIAAGTAVVGWIITSAVQQRTNRQMMEQYQLSRATERELNIKLEKANDRLRRYEGYVQEICTHKWDNYVVYHRAYNIVPHKHSKECSVCHKVEEISPFQYKAGMKRLKVEQIELDRKDLEKREQEVAGE
jgi:hypothetical protein